MKKAHDRIASIMEMLGKKPPEDDMDMKNKKIMDETNNQDSTMNDWPSTDDGTPMHEDNVPDNGAEMHAGAGQMDEGSPEEGSNEQAPMTDDMPEKKKHLFGHKPSTINIMIALAHAKKKAKERA